MADVSTPLLPFVTYTAPSKATWNPPLYAFVTYTAPSKATWSPPLYAFVTYADNVTPDPEPPTGGDMKYINLTNLYRFLTNLKNKFVKKSELQEELNSAIASVPKNDGTGATGTWNISVSGNATTATSADSADNATNSTNDSNGNNIVETYETKSDATAKHEEFNNAIALKANVSDLSDYAKKSDVVSAVIYKGTVENYSDLPSGTKVAVGWMYNITNADESHGIAAGDNVVYNGTEWDNYRGTITIDEASDSDIDSMFTV